MSSINSVIAELSSTFGFHTADAFRGKTKKGTSVAVISNIFNVVGYCQVPVWFQVHSASTLQLMAAPLLR
jgi:hypothetical protein